MSTSNIFKKTRIQNVYVEDGIVLVECKKSNIEEDTTELFSKIRYFTSAGTFYKPQKNDFVLMFRPFDIFDAKNSFAISFGKTANIDLLDGELEIGSLGSTIQFLTNEIMKLKAVVVDLSEATNVKFGDGDKSFLTEDVDAQIIIPNGSSAGTYSVTINSAGQTKVTI